MMPITRSPRLLPSFVVAAGVLAIGGVLFCMTPGRPAEPRHQPPAPGGAVVPKTEPFWQVDDVKPGMKGHGRTVMKGTKIETFQAEVIGVLKNTSPGRDMVLCRLAGLDLERTGIIAGMSGSPVYIDNKLLGAVAYGWAYGKDPIAGITPFCQMHSFVESYERRDLAEQAKPIPPGQRRPAGFGLVPVQGGGAGAKVHEAAKDVALEPGGPLAISLIRGDFDLSGIGTVTHIEGHRVYGWGHSFMGLGGCDFPLMTGYIHTVYLR